MYLLVVMYPYLKINITQDTAAKLIIKYMFIELLKDKRSKLVGWTITKDDAARAQH